jgi:hypothetical protein
MHAARYYIRMDEKSASTKQLDRNGDATLSLAKTQTDDNWLIRDCR